MSIPTNLATTVHVCEDIDKTFLLTDMLQAAGYTPAGAVRLMQLNILNPDGSTTPAPTSLIQIAPEGSGFIVTASALANWNGNFNTLSLVFEVGGLAYNIAVQVVIDPVNDAPEGADKAIAVVDGSGYVLQESDFGFVDRVENDGFKSVRFATVPTAGLLQLNGVTLAAGAEVQLADITAGRLKFIPAAGNGGDASFTFQVRDTGGTEGCNASDLDLTPNTLTFTMPATSSLGDRVWIDTDRDGVQDAGEAGVGGVSVLLMGAGKDGTWGTADDVMRTTTTLADGSYLFTGLNAGPYQIIFGGKSGYEFTTANAGGNDAVDSDVGSSGSTGIYTLGHNQTELSVDAGLRLIDTNTASLGDTVWFDTNRNGVQDNGEVGAAGVAVVLVGAGTDGVFGTADDISRGQTTSSSGTYRFDGLAAGLYQVTFGGKAGYQFTTANVGNDATDSDANVTTGKSHLVTLAVGETNLTVDAGLVDGLCASLGDRVWFDTNANGIQDAGEAGAAGVTVQLLQGGSVIGTTTTDSGGNYLFSGLAAGQYQVKFGGLTNYVFTYSNMGGNDAVDSDVDNWGLTNVVNLAAGQAERTVDAGLVFCDPRTASLGDRVWVDTNGNGIQDAGESGVSGVTVQLLQGGSVIRTTTTGSGGYYSFGGLAAGQYQVQFAAQTGYQFTTANVGNDATDSDASTTGLSHVVTLGVGESNLTVDAGLKDTNTASLGDRVWFDANRNGLQDAGEAGVSGVTVTLWSAGADALFGTTDDVRTTTTTDANGNYLFGGLAAGRYAILVGAKAGYEFTTIGADSSAGNDSDVNASGTSWAYTLAAGQTNLSVDAGMVLKETYTASLGDRLWYDANANGVQDTGESGIAGVTVQLLQGGAVIGTTTTSSTGNYAFTGLAAGQYQVQFGGKSYYQFTAANAGGNDALDSDVGSTGLSHVVNLAIGQSDQTVDAGMVFCDPRTASLGDRVWYDTDRDGVQDSTETGVSGITVTLAGAGTDGVFGTADDISRSTTTNSTGYYGFTGLAAGQYQVTFGGKTGYAFTTANATTDTVDSDANVSTGKSHVVTLAVGQSDQTVDAGLVLKDTNNACLGDRVWLDTDRDGVQDSTETGVSGVAVTLAGAGADGVFGTADDISRSTTTNSSGYYSFTGLSAGQYQVTFGGKSGYGFTTANATTDNLDSDANISTGKSHVVTLDIGESNQTVDAGLSVLKTASVGDRVWNDYDKDGIQDVGETQGIYNVKVGLYDYYDNLVATTYTNSNGNYLFSNLEAGYYYLEFDKSNATAGGYSVDNWVWTYQDRGSNDATDSDVMYGNTSYDVTWTEDWFYLAAGQADRSRDAGMCPIVIDLNGDGVQTVARSASDATFDLFGNGKGIQSGWLSGSDGFLAVDRDGNGQIDDISELFGGVAKGAGFAQLASFDSNGDGQVDAQDASFDQLRIWQDANGNHQTDAGELMTLAQAGVAAMTVDYTELPFLDRQGNLHLERSSATMADGSAVDMTDVYFNVDVADAVAAGVELPTMAELLGVDNALLDQSLGGGSDYAQLAMSDFNVDVTSEVNQALLAAMKHVDSTMAMAC